MTRKGGFATKRLIKIISITIIAALAVSGCASIIGKKSPKRASQERRVDGFQIKLTASKKSFSRGEKIDFELAVENVTHRSVTVTYPSAQTHDIEIRNQLGDTVWRWSEGRLFAQVIMEKNIPAGGRLVFKAPWPRQNNADRQVKPGRYVVVGRWLARGYAKDIEIEIEIKD